MAQYAILIYAHDSAHRLAFGAADRFAEPGRASVHHHALARILGVVDRFVEPGRGAV